MRTPCHLTSASHVRRALSFDKSLSHENPPYQLINLSRDKLPIIRDPLSHDNQAYHVISRPPPQGTHLIQCLWQGSAVTGIEGEFEQSSLYLHSLFTLHVGASRLGVSC